MITISKNIERQQKNFWSNCLFHPTDAVEDSWGRRILDKMAEDKSIKTIRIYTMFEDIVYTDMDGNLCYDFRINDLRLDYLTQKGYDLLLAYGMMPECIATNKNATSSMSKNKTRYKGKLINTSTPTDYKLWEDICYEYTKHIIERYGEEKVASWHIHCFNEPDIQAFFLSDLPCEAVDVRAREYCKLYESFEKGIRRASTKLHIGGPALAGIREGFLDVFLSYVKEKKLQFDYIAIHNYGGVGSSQLNEGSGFSVDYWLDIQKNYLDVIEKCGFKDKEIVVDEWGMAAQGFFNIEECPSFIARETEVYSSYYVKLIHEILKRKWNISKLLICLSGQHEMTTDFSGFRNFFTLNFFAKPIYNAYVLASKLYEGLVSYEADENIFVVPTKNENGNYSVLLTYCGEKFSEDLPEKEETISFEESLVGKSVTVYCIDKNTTNPYRLYKKNGYSDNLTDEQIKILREEGKIKPVVVFNAEEEIKLKLTANCTYLIEVK